MDRGKRPSKFLGNRNNRIYMDLRGIMREHALPFLPAKSLFRCTGVCRDWKLQISTPFFAHNQSNSFKAISGFFYHPHSGAVPLFVSLDPKAYGVPDPSLGFLPEPVDIRASSNALLCCQGRTGYNAYYICNPGTKQWKKLPKPNSDHGCDPAIVLIFEPSVINFVGEFKLVCGFSSELDAIEYEVYSSAEGSWRTSGEISFGESKLHPGSGVHANGVVFWQGKSSRITSFDLKTDRAQHFYPQYYARGGLVGVMNGKLCTASIDDQRLYVNLLSNVHLNKRQMHSTADMWENKYVTDFDSSMFVGSSGLGYVVFIGGDVVVIRAGEMLYSYDMKTKTTACLGEVPPTARIFPYVNSLVEI